MLKLENVQAGYKKGEHILKNINLTIAKNEVVAIVGQNGAGKSTLAKAIMNMLPQISGEIKYCEKNIAKLQTKDIVSKGLNYFMQGGCVFTHLTGDENLIFAGMKLSKKKFKQQKEKITNYFDLFQNGKSSRLKMQASYLSGGEQHQLALAMVMIQKSQFLILDEPSAGLSPGNVRTLYDVLEKIREKEDVSVLLIEQNVQFATNFSDRVALLRRGKLHEIGGNLEDIEREFFEV